MNIGTTVTAWLAALNGSAEARQTALAHTLFNVIGTVLLIPFFIPVILPVATSFFPNYAEAAVANGVTTYPNVAAPMAAIHTLFNLITTAFATMVSSVLKSPIPGFDLAAVQAESKGLHDLVRASRQGQLNRIGPNDPNSPIRVLVELDILNAYERIRAYYLNIAETLAGGKR